MQSSKLENVPLTELAKLCCGENENCTSDRFKKACSLFIHTDDFHEPTADNPDPEQPAKKAKKELRGDTELSNTVRIAVEKMKDEDGWSLMQKIGGYIANHSSLSSKNYGYARWLDLVRATEYFEEEMREKNRVYFKGKQAPK
jgi:hypothetical protein